MPYCPNCGTQVNENQDVCLNCGKTLKSVFNVNINDTGGFVWGLLGFFVPLAGLVIYLLWKDEKPRTAKACGTGALISVILGFSIPIVFFLLSLLFLI